MRRAAAMRAEIHQIPPTLNALPANSRAAARARRALGLALACSNALHANSRAAARTRQTLDALHPNSRAAGGARRALACLAPALAGAALALVPAAARAATSVPARGAALSDETTITRFANPYYTAVARERPASGARLIVRLHLWTEDGFPEVYLVLRRWVDPDERAWLLVRLPMRPNGRIGWAPEDAFGPLGLVHTRLVVDRHRLRATLFLRGREEWSSPVGVGKPSTPTPAGRFWIREKFPTGDPGGSYGPWAIGTSAYSVLTDWPGGGVVGFHGTSEPWLIPGHPSHGCIRLPNAAISQLVRLAPVGTPVSIR
jgi:hypothetical protein